MVAALLAALTPALDGTPGRGTTAAGRGAVVGAGVRAGAGDGVVDTLDTVVVADDGADDVVDAGVDPGAAVVAGTVLSGGPALPLFVSHDGFGGSTNPEEEPAGAPVTAVTVVAAVVDVAAAAGDACPLEVNGLAAVPAGPDPIAAGADNNGDEGMPGRGTTAAGRGVVPETAVGLGGTTKAGAALVGAALTAADGDTAAAATTDGVGMAGRGGTTYGGRTCGPSLASLTGALLPPLLLLLAVAAAVLEEVLVAGGAVTEGVWPAGRRGATATPPAAPAMGRGAVDDTSFAMGGEEVVDAATVEEDAADDDCSGVATTGGIGDGTPAAAAAPVGRGGPVNTGRAGCTGVGIEAPAPPVAATLDGAGGTSGRTAAGAAAPDCNVGIAGLALAAAAGSALVPAGRGGTIMLGRTASPASGPSALDAPLAADTTAAGATARFGTIPLPGAGAETTPPTADAPTAVAATIPGRGTPGRGTVTAPPLTAGRGGVQGVAGETE